MVGPLQRIVFKIKRVTGRWPGLVDVDPHREQAGVGGGPRHGHQLVGRAAEKEHDLKVLGWAGLGPRAMTHVLGRGARLSYCVRGSRLLGRQHGIVETGGGVVGIDEKVVVYGNAGLAAFDTRFEDKRVLCIGFVSFAAV